LKYATFRGRASRAEYWWWALFSALVQLVLVFLKPLNIVASITLFLPYLAVAIRRLHDTDRSGWYWLVPFPLMALELISLLFDHMAVQAHDDQGVIFWTLMLIMGLLMNVIPIIWYCQKGTAGPNRYGPPPYSEPADNQRAA
jgi:uncharacterized membrane protein YhaH (DUF805 family)